MDKEIKFNGVTMRYTVSGSGAPLILMHGWGCNRSTVESIARTAALTNMVYNVDFPGFGSSTEPDSVWGVEEYAAIIEELCRVERISSPVLVGHSFGGRVAIVLASRGEVSKVVLVDAAGVKPRHGFNYYRKVYSFKAAKFLLNCFLGQEKAASRIEKLRSSRGSSDYNNASPKMKAIMSKVVNEDLCRFMPQIKAPTLLIWGENDTATPLSDARKMEKLIPDSVLVSFPACGHYSFLDNPVAFSAVLNNFLKSK